MIYVYIEMLFKYVYIFTECFQNIPKIGQKILVEHIYKIYIFLHFEIKSMYFIRFMYYIM